ncbi:MAG: deoxyribodipyrimidine photo-lyase, partial [Pseudomonadales bacterium]|nr:deoxyribodipyrimidine photo-lyase [Pseudomonadales bacterium]
RLSDYSALRDIPSMPGTSQLSPYLVNGSLSPRTALHRALASPPGPGRDTWLGELAWRDFFKHILVDYPRVGRYRAFDLTTEHLIWSQRTDHFEAWCQGRTGFPLIDAAMRQLIHTGWMHNRLRMVTAMFLVKDLWLDWRWGERWFMQHLIDGDLAANNGGWQWSASTGVDAVPYFRIFNPWTQSQRFDPQGLFIRNWLPELAHVPVKLLHRPPTHPPLTDTYPRPIIHHEKARLHALASFKNLRTIRLP